jgi:von Willebrand factor type D domain
MKYQYAINFALALAPVGTAQIQTAWQSNTQPPIVLGSTSGSNFTIPSHCAFAFDDPHIFTFDNRKLDCQVTGDYTYVKSRTTDFEIQGRFTHVAPEVAARMKAQNGWNPGMVTKAVVINTGTPGEPIIEIDADVTTNVGNGEHLCEMKYAVDGKYVTLGADAELGGGTVTFQRRHAQERNWWDTKLTFSTSHYRNFFFKKSGLYVQTTKRFSSAWGCYINVR